MQVLDNHTITKLAAAIAGNCEQSLGPSVPLVSPPESSQDAAESWREEAELLLAARVGICVDKMGAGLQWWEESILIVTPDILKIEKLKYTSSPLFRNCDVSTQDVGASFIYLAK